MGGTELAGRFIAAGCFFVTLGGSELAGRFKLVILLCWVGATDEARLVLDDCDVAADVGRTDEISRRIYKSYMATLDDVKEWGAIADEPYMAARRLSDRFGQAI